MNRSEKFQLVLRGIVALLATVTMYQFFTLGMCMDIEEPIRMAACSALRTDIAVLIACGISGLWIILELVILSFRKAS